MLEDPIVLAILSQLQALELVDEDVDAVGVCHEEIVSLTRLL